MFSWYWAIVNNTVDQRTVPLAMQTFFAQGLFFTSLLLSVAAAIAIWLRYLKRQLRLLAVVTAGTSFGGRLRIFAPICTLAIVTPIQGNAVGQQQCLNDAAAIAATALERFSARTKAVARSWKILTATMMSHHCRRDTRNPPTRPGPAGSN